MRVVQVSPKDAAAHSPLRVHTSAKAYSAQRAPWGQSSHRALSERDLAAGLAVGLRARSESVRAVSWDDDGPRRFLHRVFCVLAAVAAIGWASPPWFGL